MLLHQQPPINCFCLLKEYEKGYGEAYKMTVAQFLEMTAEDRKVVR